MNIIHITAQGLADYSIEYVDGQYVGSKYLEFPPQVRSAILDLAVRAAQPQLDQIPGASEIIDAHLIADPELNGEDLLFERMAAAEQLRQTVVSRLLGPLLAKYKFAESHGLFKEAAADFDVPDTIRQNSKKAGIFAAVGGIAALGLPLIGPVIAASAVAGVTGSAIRRTVAAGQQVNLISALEHVFDEFDYILLSSEEAADRYPGNESIKEGIYLPHAVDPQRLVPFDTFLPETLQEKILCLFDVLSEMGAQKIIIRENASDKHEASAGANVGALLAAGLGGGYVGVKATEAEIHFESLRENVPPADLLERSLWFRNDPQLQLLLKKRRDTNNRVSYFRYNVDAETHANFDASLATKIDMKIANNESGTPEQVRADAHARYSLFKTHSLHLEITF